MANPKVAIIGAGPAGSIAAAELAENRFEVRVFEEHKEIGKPVQCTGIVTAEIENLVKPGRFILNKIKSTKIFSPNGEHIEIVHGEPEIVLDRECFDRHLTLLAEKSGAEYSLNSRFIGFERKGAKLKIRLKKNGKIITDEADFLIGADGCLSAVAKSAGIFGKRKFFAGMQAVADLQNDNKVETYLIEKGFGWAVPESKRRVRIGVISGQNPAPEFKKLLESKLGKGYEKKIISRQAGLVPVYNPKIKSCAGNVYLAGDAATMAKAATAGGIMQAVISGKAVAESIIHKKDYESLWRKRMGRELYLSLMIRNALDRFSKSDYEYLVGLFMKEKNRKILENYSRESPSKILLKLAINEPGLIRFLRYFV